MFKFYNSWRNKHHVPSFVNLCRVFHLSSRRMQRSMDSFTATLTISPFYWHLIAYISWAFSTVLFSRAVTFYAVFNHACHLLFFYSAGQFLFFVRFLKFYVTWLIDRVSHPKELNPQDLWLIYVFNSFLQFSGGLNDVLPFTGSATLHSVNSVARTK